MTWHLRRRSSAELDALLFACGADELTYSPTGGSLGSTTLPGLRRREWRCELTGTDAFDRGCDAIQAWSVHRGAGLEVVSDGPIVVGTNVALCAPLPLGFVDATCRIVEVVQEVTRVGFAYGTLSVHPGQGEESFVVRRDADGAVLFEVVAISRLAWVAPLMSPERRTSPERRQPSGHAWAYVAIPPGVMGVATPTVLRVPRP